MANIFQADKYTPLSTISELFSDVSSDFEQHPDTHDLMRLKNEEAVKRSIRNLVLTNKYERPFQPNLGSNLRKYLFEDISPTTSLNLQNEIKTTIENYEPRAGSVDVTVSPYVDENAYVVNILFYIINSNNPISLNTILYRVR